KSRRHVYGHVVCLPSTTVNRLEACAYTHTKRIATRQTSQFVAVIRSIDIRALGKLIVVTQGPTVALNVTGPAATSMTIRSQHLAATHGDRHTKLPALHRDVATSNGVLHVLKLSKNLGKIKVISHA